MTSCNPVLTRLSERLMLCHSLTSRNRAIAPAKKRRVVLCGACFASFISSYIKEEICPDCGSF